ncbi:MAG TPA: polysaccharide biosynthesis protein [Chloroflexota bacterium]|nr:polysaccharide biosynthesis protein [Chloroflexota bacterium]HUM67793.1 polysaccharide biosynthesis protein [Chloroflexota bacterium]
MNLLDNKHVLITGGTGSLGQVLLRRILTGEQGRPRKITIFSRDESKQHDMHMEYLNRLATTDEAVYELYRQTVAFRIGDVRDYHGVTAVMRDADILFNAAALKHVPACEYSPFEAVKTNILGPENIIRAIREHNLPVQTVIGISTDKACKPVNVMGMTKAIQERLFVQANLECPQTRLVCVRYGNVLASRGSVIPLFHKIIRNGGPITITTPEMTRFLLSLNQAVDTVFAALNEAHPGEIYVPRVPSARVVDVAAILVGNRSIETKIIGIRPGEKIHEILVSEEEAHRTAARGAYFVIMPSQAELRHADWAGIPLDKEYSSADHLMSAQDVRGMLAQYNLLDVEKGIPQDRLLL